jgi:hypothetical protein
MTDGQLVHDKRTNSYARTNDHGLTEKQEAFARGVANGLTLKEAYERAYDASEMAKSSIYSEASKLMDHPLVAQRARQLMEERQKKTHAIDALRIRQHVFDRLMIESVDDDSPPNARIKALELLGKIDVVSMFKEQKGEVVPEQADVKMLEEKLKEALSRLIDVSPRNNR